MFLSVCRGALLAFCITGVVTLPSALPAQTPDINGRDERGLTALERAVNQGNTDAVAALIRAGADVNTKSSGGRTVIGWAAFQNRPEIVRVLAKSGADLNAKDQQGWAPLALALSAKHFAVIKILIDAGAEANRDQLREEANGKQSPGLPLRSAASKGDLGEVRALIQLGADVNAKDASGRTILFSAAPNAIPVLIGAGADVNAKDERGWTALTLAAIAGNAPVVQALIGAGSDTSATGPNGWNALMYAVRSGDIATTQALIPVTNVNYRNADDISALTLARWACHREIIELVTRAGGVIGPAEWKRAPRFEDFRVATIYKGAPAPVDLRSNPYAATFRTRLREGARKGPNFAGHYTVVAWGCGSNCESNMIVDARTGKVYSGFGDERGAEFRLNSSLVIADPGGNPDARAYDDDPTDKLPVHYYSWSDHRLKSIYEESCSVVDGHRQCGCSDSR